MISSRSIRVRTFRRRGAALLVAIVCVSIATAVMYGLVQLALLSYREVILEQRRVQVGWLADSAVDRVAAKLAEDRAYEGEVWSLSAEELRGRHDAVVAIEVQQVEGQSGWRRIRIVADCPVELPERVRQTREFRMPVHP